MMAHRLNICSSLAISLAVVEVDHMRSPIRLRASALTLR
jgi:hypothetical protein